MLFEGMTPQEAGRAVLLERLLKPRLDEDADVQIGLHVTAACQHFYERGQASMRPKYGPAAPGEGVAAMKPIDAFFAGWLAAEDNHIDPQDDVRQFMEAFGQAMPATPQWPDQATMDLRVRLVAEEFCEWLRDSGYMYKLSILGVDGDGSLIHVFEDRQLHHRYAPNLPKSADALIDLLYVTIGSLLAMGIDMCPLWAEVQRCNMAKLGGPVVNGKQLKPEGWQPPDIAGLLKNQGWEEDDNAVS